MSTRAYHRVPAMARHVVAAAEKLVDCADLECKMMETTLANAWIEQE